MSHPRSSFAEYAASNSPFNQFNLESRVNASSHQAYNSFVSTEQRGLTISAPNGGHIQPAVMATAFPLSLPSAMAGSNFSTCKLQEIKSEYPVFNSNSYLEARSNLAYDNFKIKPYVEESALPDVLEKSSLTAITFTGLRTANNLVDGLGGFIKHKLRLTNLTLDIYDRTNMAVESGIGGSTSFICGSLGGISKTVSTVTGYGFVVSEGLIMAGSTSGVGLIPATIFVSSALPVVDMLSNGIGNAVESACQQVSGGIQNCLDQFDHVEPVPQLDLQLKVIENELFIMSLDAIRKAVPDDFSTCDYPTLKITSEAVGILKDMVQSMQVNGLKTSDAVLGDLSQEMNIIEDRFNNTVRECVLKRIHNQSVSTNTSSLFTVGRQLPLASVHSLSQIKKL